MAIVKVSEIIEKNINLDEALSKLAMTRAQRAWELDKSLRLQLNLIFGADTVVVLEGQILGPPKKLNQAFEFLSRMSGLKHCVKTSLAPSPHFSQSSCCDRPTIRPIRPCSL